MFKFFSLLLIASPCRGLIRQFYGFFKKVILPMPAI
nr:MAG TPA: hypothetical protein [Caudoviricetes sp.]